MRLFLTKSILFYSFILISSSTSKQIIPILDDQCRAPGTTDKTFANDIYNKCKGTSRFEANFRQVGALRFGIQHYAGPVEYDTAGFVEKNRDDLPKEATELLLSSSNKFVTTLADILSSTSAGAKPGKKITVGGQFSQQLSDLRAKIDLTSPHYVRCLKPNDQLIPDHFDPVIVADQLRCAGVVEAVRVSRVGYPQRYSHALFVNRYRILGLQALKNASKGTVRKKPVEVLVEAISKRMFEMQSKEGIDSEKLDDEDAETSNDGIQVGKTKVFLRRSAYDAIEKLRNNEIKLSAIIIQTSARRYLASRYLKEALTLTVKVQCLVRRMIATKKVNEVRRQHNARVIQKYYRRMVARDKFVKTVAVVSWGQRYWRGRVGRVRYNELNSERKAIVIQKRVRGYQSARAYSMKKSSAITIQCALRCYRAKSELKSLQAHARDLSAVADERDILRNETLSLRQALEEAKENARREAEKAAAAFAASAQAQKAADSKLEAEVEQLRQQTTELRDELEKAQSETETISSQLADERESAKASIEEINTRLVEADQARAKAEAETSIAKASLDEALERAKAAEESKHDAVAKANEETDATKNRLEEVSTELTSTREELASAKKQLLEAQTSADFSSDESDKQLKDITSELTSVQRELATTRKQLVEAQSAAENASEANQKLREQTVALSSLQNELDSTKKQLSDAQTEVVDANNAKLKLKEEIDALKNAQAIPGHVIKDSEEEILLLSDELALVNAEKESLQKELDEVKQSMQDASASTESTDTGKSRSADAVIADTGRDVDEATSLPVTKKIKELEEENAKLREQLQTSSQEGVVATNAPPTDSNEVQGRLKKDDLTSLQKELLDAKATISRLEKEKSKQSQKPMLSIPEDSEPDANMVKMHEMQDEIERLRKEIDRLEDEQANGSSSGDSLLVRYQELSRLSSALVEKDKEIDELKDQIRNLKTEFNDQVQLFKASSTSDDEGDTDASTKDPFETRSHLGLSGGDDVEDPSSAPDPDSFSPSPQDVPRDMQMALIAYRDEVEALREINEILRKDVERVRRDCETAKWEAKEERERSAKEIESFAQTLRGVDELRAAAEAMSREITKNRKYYMSEDSEGAFEAISSVNRANQILDASRPGGSGAGGVGLWARMTGGFGGGDGQGGAPGSETPPRQKGRRRRKKRGSDNESVISAFF